MLTRLVELHAQPLVTPLHPLCGDSAAPALGVHHTHLSAHWPCADSKLQLVRISLQVSSIFFYLRVCAFSLPPHCLDSRAGAAVSAILSQFSRSQAACKLVLDLHRTRLTEPLSGAVRAVSSRVYLVPSCRASRLTLAYCVLPLTLSNGRRSERSRQLACIVVRFDELFITLYLLVVVHCVSNGYIYGNSHAACEMP